MLSSRILRAVLVVTALTALSACGAPGRDAAPTPFPSSPSSSPSSSPLDLVDAALAAMTLTEKVGQLFIVGTKLDAVNPVTLAAIRDGHAGGIFLHGRSDQGAAATAALVAQYAVVTASDAPPLWVSTDQEGGEVQVLSGSDFDPMPSALEQSQMTEGALRDMAQRWGGQLASAGVNLNLAPVVDVIDGPEQAAANPPIGRYEREYGYGEASVPAKAGAFAAGMRQAGITPVFKHFPGLGRVTANTDTTAGVTDTTVGSDSADVDVYRSLFSSAPGMVMMSTAIYTRLDPSQPAAFSPAIVQGLLRGKLGFTGPVITDDLSEAAQVQQYTPAERALRAIAAGADIVLISNNPAEFTEMSLAVLAKAQQDHEFAAMVHAAARRVLVAKQALHR